MDFEKNKMLGITQEETATIRPQELYKSKKKTSLVQKKTFSKDEPRRARCAALYIDAVR